MLKWCKVLAWKEVLRVVVFVRWKDFTSTFSSFVWKTSNFEREARQVVQTGERARQTVFDNTFSKTSDVQEGEFVFFEINKFKSLGYSFGFRALKSLQDKAQMAKTLERKEPACQSFVFCQHV